MKGRRATDRGLAKAMEIADQAKLPQEIRLRLRRVLTESGLTGDALIDVARELVTHFEDGLEAGKSGDDLAKSFGDEQLVASMIAREKTRVEPDLRDRMVVGSGGGDPAWRRLARNVRYAARRAIQSPGFTLTAILSLAIGIGANTAIFTLVQQVLLDSPPYEDPERLYDVYVNSPEFPFQVMAYPEFEAFREGTSEAFSHFSAAGLGFAQLEEDGRTELLFTEWVTAGYFEALGIRASAGRLMEEGDEDGRSADPVAVLAHRFWREAYGGDPGVVGRDIVLAGRPFTILGVADPAFGGSFQGIVPDIFLPVLLKDQIEPSIRNPADDWNNHSYFVKARLRPEATVEQARVLAANVAQDLVAQDRWTSVEQIDLVATSDVTLFPPLDRFIRMAAALLTVVVGFVLLIACANLASFLLARSLDRRREIAVRLALGASRGSLVAQLATETVLLSVVGGVAGMVLGSLALKGLVNADLPIPIPLTLDVGLNSGVFLFGLAVSVVAGLLFGLVPALDASRTDVAATIKDEAAGVGRSGVFSMRGLLVSGQVAVSVVLLVGAGLFLRSFQSALSVDPGFGAQPAATVLIALPTGKYTDEEARPLVRELLEEFRGLPGVVAAGLASNLPLNTLSTQTAAISIDGVEPPPGRESISVDEAAATPGFLDALGVPILRGRDFDETDIEGGEPVIIVNEAFVDRFWPGDDGLGKRVRFGGREATVIGVSATTKVRNLGEAPRPFAYHPFDQSFDQSFRVVARTQGNPEVLANDLVSAARSLEPMIWGWEPQSLARHIGVMLLPTRLGAVVISVFAGLALVLASVGLYGIVSYSVAQRTREVGIRMSLGADVGRMIRLLMSAGLRPVALGGVLGLVLALLTGRLLGALLFGVDPFDPLAYGAVAIVFVTVSTLAAWAPARRASRVNPVSALRAD